MFDPNRFLRLARAQWAEYWRTYAWFLGIGVIVHLVLLLVILSGSGGFRILTHDGQGAFYFTGLFLTAPLFAARYFQAMGRRGKQRCIAPGLARVHQKNEPEQEQPANRRHAEGG